MSAVIGDIDIDSFDGNGLAIIGTEEADLLIGTNRDDLILGLGGDDTIRGLNGRDLIDGGADNDLIQGGQGDDIIQGGSGNDSIFGQEGDDLIDGSSGDDLIQGGKGFDTIFGGSGSDTIFGGSGQDVFEFNIEDFSFDTVDTVGDFHVGQDSIVINGVGEDDEITFDADTNSVLLNGDSVINLTLAETFRAPILQEQDDEDGGYEII